MATNYNNAANVGVGKPNPSGAIFVAPIGTELPTNASAAKSDAFKCLGYVSDAGLTISESRETEEVKAWGGDTVRKSQTSYDKTVQFTAIEANEEVFKLRFGKDNVTVDENGNVSIKHNSAELDHFCMIIEMAPTSSTVLRIVIPDGQVTEPGDTSYTDSDAIGYDMTVSCYPGSDGDSMKEYRAKTVPAA